MFAISKAPEPKDENNPDSSRKESVIPDNNAVAPVAGEETHCTEERRAAYQTEMRVMDDEMYPIEEQLRNLLTRADEVQECLMYSQDHVHGFDQVVPSFLRTCQPFFTYLESMARDSLPDRSPLPAYMRARLLQFSQQLCSKLEQLVLSLASFGYLSLEESDPAGISYFYIGRCQVDSIKVSIFRYCCPAPFLASTNSRLYKRMRWNVEQGEVGSAGNQDVQGGGQVENREREVEGHRNNSTEYYFLCYEDRQIEREGEAGQEQAENKEERRAARRMWSIGQWVQMYPDPNTDNIYDWVLCAVPHGQYKQLLCLGEEEPLSCFATDRLLEVLSSRTSPSVAHSTGQQTVLYTV